MKTVSNDITVFLAFGICHPENLASPARSRYGEVRLVVVQKCTNTHSTRANSLSQTDCDAGLGPSPLLLGGRRNRQPVSRPAGTALHPNDGGASPCFPGSQPVCAPAEPGAARPRRS